MLNHKKHGIVLLNSAMFFVVEDLCALIGNNYYIGTFKEKFLMNFFKLNNLGKASNYILIVIASFIYAAGISLFLDKNSLAAGGVTGIAVIFNRVTGIETGTLYFLFNIPIIAFGMHKFGFRFIFKTLFAVFFTSIFTNLLSIFGSATDDLLLASLAGSFLMAVGIGLIFKTGGTTGGTDIIIKVLRVKYPHLKTGFLFLMTDCIIVAGSFFVFKSVDIALYALLSVFVTGRALDWVLYGGDEVKLVLIVTDFWESVGKRLIAEADVGLTYLNGMGGYTMRDKKVIMCVVKNQTAPKIERIVKEEDRKAFMIVSSANEIFGEGYKDIYKDKL